MKNKILTAVFFSVFLLITPNVKAANFTDNQTVDANKTWTIKFTSDVGFDTLTKQGITVTDSKGNTVLTDVKLGQDSKTVTVTPPEGGYTPGESYILDVGTKTHSSKGTALKNNYKLHFNIKKDNNTTIPCVTSVSTIGLRQIKVVFNQKVDKNTAEDVNNYTVDGSDLTPEWSKGSDGAYDNAVLQDDNKTVLITLKDARKQYDDVDITIKKGILSPDKSSIVPRYTQSVTFSDISVPTIESLEVKGNSRIIVEFSEPVNVGNNSIPNEVYSKFKINDKNLSFYGLNTSISGAKDTVEDDCGKYWANKIDFYFDKALPTGNNTFKVSDGDAQALEDAAGFPVLETTQNFNVNTLSTTPQITSVTANDGRKVYVNFDRPMDEETAVNISNYKINDENVTITKAELKKDDTQVELSVSGLNEGSNKLYIDNNVKDIYGNNIGDTTYTFDLTEDTIKPVVTSVSALNDTTIRVIFNKNVDAAYATNISNYKLKDGNGIDITSEISGVNIKIPGDVGASTGDVFDIPLSSGYKLADSTYTITIKNIQDMAYTPNVMDDYTTAFDGSNDVDAEVIGVYGVIGSPRKITLIFNKEMDPVTLKKTSNYRYCNAGGGDDKELPSWSNITVSNDNKSVTIELPDEYTYVDHDGTVANPTITSADNQVTKIYAVGTKDKSGNDVQIGSEGGYIENAASAGITTIKANSIKLYYDNDNLKADVIFTNPIDANSIDNSKLDVYLAGVKADSASVNGSKVTLTFNSNHDDSTVDTKINTIKEAGLSARLTLGSATGTTSASIKDVMGSYVSTGTVSTTPYYYDTAPRTIVLKDASGKSINWKAQVSGTTAAVTIVFDTPIDANSVKISDFKFAINDTSLTPDTAVANGNTVVFTFNTASKVGSNTVGDYFKADGASTITVTPNSNAKSISTKKDENDDYAHYTPSDNDNNGIKIIITAGGEALN